MSIQQPTSLHQLLDESLAFPPEYADQLSSHLPMALAALDGLGADEARLRIFFATYRRRFGGQVHARAAAEPLQDWVAFRGRFDLFGAFLSTFRRHIAMNGRDTTLREAVPKLMRGVGAAAFHCLIRTAHAVESRHDGELAAALAYWAARWMPLDPPAVTSTNIEHAAVWLDTIETCWLESVERCNVNASLISERMQSAVGTIAYSTTAGQLSTRGRSAEEVLRSVALAAAVRYAASGNFTILHLCTGTRAARVLAPWMPLGAEAWEPLWHAIAAATVAALETGIQSLPVKAGSRPDWPSVCAAALASDNDHMIKLVHTMAVQQLQEPRPEWLHAAARAVGL